MLSKLLDLIDNKFKQTFVIVSVIILITLNIYNVFLSIKSDIYYLKKEITELKKQNLLNQKIKIDQELKYLLLKEKKENLNEYEKSRITDLMIEREKILIELSKITIKNGISDMKENYK